MSLLTVIILTHNEADRIKDLVNSLKNHAKIIVVDDYSNDGTDIIAKKSGAVVLRRHLKDDFSAQRNYAYKQVKKGWILFIDADEWVNENLMTEIKKVISFGTHCVYKIKRSDFFFNKKMKYGELNNVSFVRLMPANSGKWKRKVHEFFDSNLPHFELEYDIRHDSHLSIEDFAESIRKYSLIHSKELEKERKPIFFLKVLLFPFAKFIYSFIVLQGFRDGIRGFIYAMFMSMHSFIAWSQYYIKKKRIGYEQ